MDLMEAMRMRHSVRQYTDQPISSEIVSALQAEIDACNRESGLHIQLAINEPNAFDSMMAHYGNFGGVKNYIALVGQNNAQLDETCGYYGERLILLVQQLGLNSCWVAMTYSKKKASFSINKGEKLCSLISIGYGKTSGVPHKSKPMAELMKSDAPVPEWFLHGMEAVLLAPTAMNQQKFVFIRNGTRVSTKIGLGLYTKIDLGIAKYHFEVGAGKSGWQWDA